MCMVDTRETTQQWKKKKSSCKCGSAKKDTAMDKFIDAPMCAEATSLSFSESKMTEVFKSEDDKKREYLRGRLNDAYWNKELANGLKYRVRAEGPKTLSDLVKRVKAGDYTADTQEMDREYSSWWGLADAINWRKEPADFNGYKSATSEMGKAKQNALDIINVSDAEAGLEALKAFEATEF